MNADGLRQQISQFLDFKVPQIPIAFATHEVVAEQDYTRLLISYTGREGDRIPAFLLLPPGVGPFAAVMVHHQHHSQRHFGKSEVCGLVGDPLQAFGPALARSGIVVLAPDSICFEDRRRNQAGTEPHTDDVAQHVNELCYRLLRGDTLMRKVLDDSARGISLLQQLPQVDETRIGVMGHSYGGNTVLFHTPLDERIRFACASGAACSFSCKMAHQIGIELAEVIPGFAARYDLPELISCMGQRRLLLISASEDIYSKDAAEVIRNAQLLSNIAGGELRPVEHKRFDGGHALTQERFDFIVKWLNSCAQPNSRLIS